MVLINSLKILFMICVISLMSLENSESAAVGVQKFSIFRFKKTRPPTHKKANAQFFVPQKRVQSRVTKQTTISFLNYWTKAVRDMAKNKPTDDEYKEQTLYKPKYTKNKQGIWVLNNWGPTAGLVWQDTRFHEKNREEPRMTAEQNLPLNYYPPNATRSTVCHGKSTIYNIPREEKYLTKGVHYTDISSRVFWNSLRREIYRSGRYDECHDPVKYTNWLNYQECTIKRNQRIEYLIPKYPLHQQGYFAYYKLYNPSTIRAHTGKTTVHP